MKLDKTRYLDDYSFESVISILSDFWYTPMRDRDNDVIGVMVCPYDPHTFYGSYCWSTDDYHFSFDGYRCHYDAKQNIWINDVFLGMTHRDEYFKPLVQLLHFASGMLNGKRIAADPDFYYEVICADCDAFRAVFDDITYE